MAKWQVVFSSRLLHKAEIVKAVLSDEGMAPILIDRQDSIYKIGYFEVMVKPDEVIKAIKFIEDDVKFG